MAGRSRDSEREDARLAELALGILDPSEREAVESAIADSAELSAEAAALRRTVADLDALIEPVAPSAGLRERVLRSADPRSRFEGFAVRVAELFDFSVERAREILAAIGDPGAAWVDPGIPGVRLFHFEGGPRVAGADCGLVALEPGVEFVPHVHRGGEWSLNLQGSAVEDSGQTFEPGDLVHRGDGSRHTFRSIGDEPYVFAVVLHGGFNPDDGMDRIS